MLRSVLAKAKPPVTYSRRLSTTTPVRPLIVPKLLRLLGTASVQQCPAVEVAGAEEITVDFRPVVIGLDAEDRAAELPVVAALDARGPAALAPTELDRCDSSTAKEAGP